MAPTRRSVINSNDVSLQPLTAEDVTNDLTLTPVTSRTGTTSSSTTTTTPTTSEHNSIHHRQHNNDDDLSNNNNNNNNNRINSNQNLSIDQIYQSTKQITRENHWRNNPYAAGLVEPTWKEEISRTTSDDSPGGNDNDANGPNRQCCADVAEPDMDPTCGCLIVSGYVCGMMNAGRVGNMAILKERHVMVDEVISVDDSNDDDDDDVTASSAVGGKDDGTAIENNGMQGDSDEFENNDVEEGGSSTSKINNNNNKRTMKRKVSKREIDLIVGPYWPMMVFVTYPLILGVSTWTAVAAIFVPNYNIILVTIWSTMTFGLCFSLFSVAFRDPGILPKYKQIPSSDSLTGSNANATKRVSHRRQHWRWVDSAQSYAPRDAMYDPDCAVIVEEFDHTCPWTGTAIGKKNMFAFQCFIGFLFSCLILDIILLTSSSISVP